MSILDDIHAHKKDEVRALIAGDARALYEAVNADLPPPRNFTGSMARCIALGQNALIAEIKRASPSKGPMREEVDASVIAKTYREGGACCLSVVTDRAFFRAEPSDLERARAASGLPVLRKDFVIDPIQVLETRAMQADAILLILAMLGDDQARELEATAEELGLHVLIEVHNEAELARAHDMNARLIGTNNRDLATFTVDLTTSERLAAAMEPGRIAISESGISGPDDVARLRRAGIGGFLIGETLMKAPDILSATRALTAHHAEIA